MSHPYLDELVNYCIPAAQSLLKKNGEFYPFSAAIRSGGELNPTAIYDGNEHPRPSNMIDQLIALFRRPDQQGDIEAIAICYDGRVKLEGQENKDAITIFVEHKNGECVTVYMPYKKGVIRRYVYDAIIATVADRRVFSS